MYHKYNVILLFSIMYILGIGPEFLPTAERVDYIKNCLSDNFFGNSFFVAKKRKS